MKLSLLTSTATLFSLSAFTATCAVAMQDKGFEQGLSGGLSIAMAFNEGTSQFNTDDDNAITKDLNNNGQQLSGGSPFILGRVQYAFDNTAIFIGNSEDQIADAQFQAEIGVMHQFDNGIQVTGALFGNMPGMDETWQDPYLLNQKRETSDQAISGGRVAVSLAVIPLSFSYAYANSEVDNDQIGTNSGLTPHQMNQLKRNSDYYRSSANLTIPLSDSFFLAPGIYFSEREADGDAQSNEEVGAQLGVQAIFGRHSIMGTIGASASRYDQINPIFGKRRDSESAGIFSVYSYDKPFNLNNTVFTVMSGVEEVDSDIDFYDSSSAFVATGIAYTF